MKKLLREQMKKIKGGVDLEIAPIGDGGGNSRLWSIL